MKKLIILFIPVLICITSSAQQDTAIVPNVKNDLLLKSKNQNTSGWIMLIGGAGLAIYGYSTYVSHVENSSSIWAFSDGKGLGVGTVGLLVMSGGGILLRASKRNKNKAMSMTFSDQSIELNKLKLARVPSVTLVVEL